MHVLTITDKKNVNKAKWHQYHPKARYDRLNPYDTPLTMPPPPHPDDEDEDDAASMSTIQPAYVGRMSRAASASTLSSVQTESTPQPQVQRASRKRYLCPESADTVDSEHALHMQSMRDAHNKRLQRRTREYEILLEEERQEQEMNDIQANINCLRTLRMENSRANMMLEEDDENEDDMLANKQLLEFF